MNKGVIYKIFKDDLVYFGSTTQKLKKRILSHRNFKKNNTASKKLFFNDDGTKCETQPTVEILEEIFFNNVRELHQKENIYIKENKCLNVRKAYLTPEEKKEMFIKSKKEYLLRYPERRKETCKKYYDKIKKKKLLDKQKQPKK